MFTAAALRLAELVSDEDLAAGMLFPRLGQLRPLTREIALAVARAAMEAGVADPVDDDRLAADLDAMMWEPRYVEIRPG